MPKVVPISDDPHFSDYAEMPQLDWVDKLNEQLRRERWKRIETALLVLGCALLLWMTYLGVGR